MQVSRCSLAQQFLSVIRTLAVIFIRKNIFRENESGKQLDNVPLLNYMRSISRWKKQVPLIKAHFVIKVSRAPHAMVIYECFLLLRFEYLMYPDSPIAQNSLGRGRSSADDNNSWLPFDTVLNLQMNVKNFFSFHVSAHCSIYAVESGERVETIIIRSSHFLVEQFLSSLLFLASNLAQDINRVK